MFLSATHAAMSKSKEPSSFMTIADILGKDPAELHGKMIRTIGSLQRYEVKRSLIWLKDWKSVLQLVIDSRVIEPVIIRQNSIFQFIGELDSSGTRSSGAVLKALAYRCVDGLDMDLYMKAHAVKFVEPEVHDTI